MNRLSQFFFTVVLCVSSTTILSPAYSQTINSKDVALYFELSGINALLNSVPEQLKDMQLDAVEEYGESSSDVIVLNGLIEAWQYPVIQKQLSNAIKNTLTEEQLSALLYWQNSTLAKQFKDKDSSTNQALFEQDFISFINRLPVSMPDKEHVALINELIDAKQMVDSMVDLTLSVSRPVMMALADTETAKRDGMTVEVIEQQLLELEQLLVEDLSEQIALLSYYLYKDVSIKDLHEYTAFYHSDLGQLELAILNKALHQSIALWQTYYEDVSYNILLSSAFSEE